MTQIAITIGEKINGKKREEQMDRMKECEPCWAMLTSFYSCFETTVEWMNFKKYFFQMCIYVGNRRKKKKKR